MDVRDRLINLAETNVFDWSPLVDATVVVRSDGSGVWCGALVRGSGSTIELSNARRVWYWDGAASLSELSAKGVKHPQASRMPAPVDRVVVLGVCEVIPMTVEAIKSIFEDVPVWTAH